MGGDGKVATRDVIGSRVRAMSREELAVLWQRRWRRPPPKGLSRRQLEGNAAWALQAEVSVGLSASTRRRLEILARSGESQNDEAVNDEQSMTAVRPVPRWKLRPGSRLIREWQGRNHVVEVVEGGFIYGGQNFTSLTSIARKITGTRWSGPRFFGLHKTASSEGRGRPVQKRHQDDRKTETNPAREDHDDG